jgi:hypothetical protein
MPLYSMLPLLESAPASCTDSNAPVPYPDVLSQRHLQFRQDGEIIGGAAGVEQHDLGAV